MRIFYIKWGFLLGETEVIIRLEKLEVHPRTAGDGGPS